MSDWIEISDDEDAALTLAQERRWERIRQEKQRIEPTDEPLEPLHYATPAFPDYPGATPEGMEQPVQTPTLPPATPPVVKPPQAVPTTPAPADIKPIKPAKQPAAQPQAEAAPTPLPPLKHPPAEVQEGDLLPEPKAEESSPQEAAKEPWQLPISHLADQSGVTFANDSDATIHHAKVGTYRTEHGKKNGRLQQLVELPVDDPRIRYGEMNFGAKPGSLEGFQPRDIAKRDRFAAMKTESPPIEMEPSGKGDELEITDGHHRLEAAIKRGDKTIKAWVPVMGEDGKPMTHKDAIAKAVAAGHPVPEEVLHDYPDLQKQSEPTSIVHTPEFKNWFSGSKAVEPDTQEPMVMFHGGPAKIDKFSDEHRGKATGSQTAQLGYFFSPDPVEGKRYAKQGNWQGEGHVNKAYLSVKNPYKMSGGEFARLSTQGGANDDRSKRLVERLKSEGYDGIHVDHGGWHRQPNPYGRDYNIDEWVAFEPDQIKVTN